jgi:hypothetical protein
MIPFPLAVITLADKIMSWYGITAENQNAANRIISELEGAKRMYPIRRLKKDSRFFTLRKYG